jgi:predicted dehydrogenase
MQKPITLAVCGAGNRGNAYAHFSELHPDRLKIVAAAEPSPARRAAFAKQYGLQDGQVFSDWRELAAQPRLADAVVVSMQDSMHCEPAVALAERGYALLLEKPMSPRLAECRQIVAAARKADIPFAVCHVLRYTPYTRRLKALLDSGVIGEIVSIQHLEPVGFWHQAHSFVRGNWRNTAESSPMLLAKSCHDVDWLSYIAGARCRQVSSFGSLTHFRPEHKPAGATDRCLDCAVERECAYSAVKIYLERFRGGTTGWPVSVITNDVSEAGITQALREGPYGRCVYACDNDVVDHQVVNFEFVDGKTATFTMTAFTNMAGRRTSIFGTQGELYCDSDSIQWTDFRTGSEHHETIDLENGMVNHGGGDYGLMDAFTRALASGDLTQVLSGPAETLESHTIVFAAEQSRLSGQTVQMDEFNAQAVDD